MVVPFTLSLLTALQLAESPGTNQLRLVRTLAAAVPAAANVRIEDAKVLPSDDIVVLYTDSRVAVFRGDSLIRSWGGRGTAPGRFIAPQGIAIGSHGQVYVFDAGLNAISIFDSLGVFLRREILPIALSSYVSLSISNDGDVLVSAYSYETQPAQVYEFCPMLNCFKRSWGQPRATIDSLALRFFQGGVAITQADTLIFVGLNPYRFIKFNLSSGEMIKVANDSFLPDGEPLAFKRLANDRLSINNAFPRSTGLVRLHDQRFAYTAVFPLEAKTVLRILSPDGELLYESAIPAFLDVRGTLRNGDLMLVRSIRSQEIAIYRLTKD
jgi:hypothetical protein